MIRVTASARAAKAATETGRRTRTAATTRCVALSCERTLFSKRNVSLFGVPRIGETVNPAAHNQRPAPGCDGAASGVVRTRPSHNPRGLSTASRGRLSQTRQTRRASLFPGTSTRAWGAARKSASARWVPGGHPDGRQLRLVRGGCARGVTRRSTTPTRRALPADGARRCVDTAETLF